VQEVHRRLHQWDRAVSQLGALLAAQKQLKEGSCWHGRRAERLQDQISTATKRINDLQQKVVRARREALEHPPCMSYMAVFK
jgi:hypothetical protein